MLSLAYETNTETPDPARPGSGSVHYVAAARLSRARAALAGCVRRVRGRVGLDPGRRRDPVPTSNAKSIAISFVRP